MYRNLRFARLVVLVMALIFVVQAAGFVDVVAQDSVTLRLRSGPQPDAPDWQKQQRADQIARFEAMYPYITIEDEVPAPGTNYRQEYDRNLAAGTEPTTMHGLPYVDIQTRIADGTIADITEFVEDWDLMEQGLVFMGYATALQDMEGNWYAVPYDAYQQGLVYNRRLVEEAGLDPDDPPETWDEFMEWGQALTDPDKPQFGFGLIGMAWTAWPFTNFVWLAGGEMVEQNEDGTWRVSFNSEDGVEALMFWHDLIWECKCVQRDVLQDYAALNQDFQQERIAMFWGNFQTVINGNRQFGTELANFSFAPMPYPEGGRPANLTGGQVWTISPRASDAERDAAWKYIQFMSYDEEQLMWNYQVEDDNGGLSATPPMRLDVDKLSVSTAWPDWWGAELRAVAEHSQAEPWAPHWNDIKNMLVDPIQAIILDEGATPEDAMKALNEVAERIYSQFPEDFHE
jgi:multiple sugar transport system substrate-binding protein